jgi:hypothetical protein
VTTAGAQWAEDTGQLEALVLTELARILSVTIEIILDLDILRANREAEAQERRQIARALPSGGKGAA